MHRPKVTIGLVLYRGCEKYLGHSLPGLFNQDYPNVEFLIRDQSPNGEIFDYIKNNLPQVFEKATIAKGENLMHSGGHNALMGQMTGDYYIAASEDMLYPPDLASQIVATLERPENRPFGSATVKLMQWDFENQEKTTVIDSVGIGLTRAHYFFDIGQGQKDKGQWAAAKPLGPSGALGIYRKKALEAVRYQNEYFDPLLHYKNDVDLAYRLQWAGHPCLPIPCLKVYHDRQVSSRKNRKTRSRFDRENSFFGHLVVLKKNTDKRFSALTKLETWFYNTSKWLFASVFEPYLRKQYKEVKKHMPEIEARKKAMKRTVAPTEIENLMQ
ncbi:MAG: glycosyltransferase [Candidatus Peregrinibacteria bacterium]